MTNYPDFARGFQSFRPCVAETRGIRQLVVQRAQSGRLVYHPDACVKLADLRRAGNISSKTSTDAFRDVFQPRGVTLSKGARQAEGMTKPSITTWVIGVRLASEEELDSAY